MTGMQRALAGFAMAALLVGAGPAHAQAQGQGQPDVVRQLLATVLDNLHTYECGAAKCAPATAAEKANPPISNEDATLVVERGLVSAAGMHCGMEWGRRNFGPLMTYLRDDRKQSDRQMAIISALHGMSQALFTQVVQEQGPCSPQLRVELDTVLDFKP